MTKTLRWRVLVLQAGLIGILVFCAGFVFWGNSFIHNQISTDLTAQQIYFPAANSPAIAVLPAADATATNVSAGQQLTSGEQARLYAHSFIAVHLSEVAGGLPY